MDGKYKHVDLTERIIKHFFAVYNNLGYGFLEKIYENSLAIELRKARLICEQQKPITIHYQNEIVGEYFADLVVESKIIIEIKAAKAIAEEHEAQLLNYLKATPYEVGLLLNFGPKADLSRKAFDNKRKGTLLWLNPSA